MRRIPCFPGRSEKVSRWCERRGEPPLPFGLAAYQWEMHPRVRKRRRRGKLGPNNAGESNKMGDSRAWTRRQFAAAAVAGTWNASIAWRSATAQVASAESSTSEAFRLKYLLASCLYGYTDVREILPQVARTGAGHLDLWPKVHGSQREQLDEIGEEGFRELLERHDVKLGCLTRYDLGPFRLREEMQLAARMGCGLIVTGAAGPKGLAGADLKQAVAQFVETMKPHLEVAEECGVTVAVENHGNSLIESPDSMKWLAEMAPSSHLAIAFAPYHLPQDAALLAELIRALDAKIAVFYAWQHGKGSMTAMPPEDQLLQMPGRGPLDFRPLLLALRDCNYAGFTSIFMHPYPRGRFIRETVAEVTAEVNRAAAYLEQCLTG